MVQKVSLFRASSSRAKGKGVKPRKRPSKSQRKQKVREDNIAVAEIELKKGEMIGSRTKRKTQGELKDGPKGASRLKPKMVQKEGLST